MTASDSHLAKTMTRRMYDRNSRLTSLAARLDGLSPLAVLARGYAVCWVDGRDRIIRDAGAVRVGDRVRVTLERGELRCNVIETASPDDTPRPS